MSHYVVDILVKLLPPCSHCVPKCTDLWVKLQKKMSFGAFSLFCVYFIFLLLKFEICIGLCHSCRRLSLYSVPHAVFVSGNMDFPTSIDRQPAQTNCIIMTLILSIFSRASFIRRRRLRLIQCAADFSLLAVVTGCHSCFRDYIIICDIKTLVFRHLDSI